MKRPPLFLSVLLVSLLGACAADTVRLPGERLSLDLFQPRASLPPIAPLEESIDLPVPQDNAAWLQKRGSSSHMFPHPSLGERPEEVWRVKAGARGFARLASPPVIAGSRLFILDGRAVVRAFDKDSGERLWRRSLAPEGEEPQTAGGGLAFSAGRLFAATGLGTAAALDPETGEVIWQDQANTPFRSPPTVAGNRLFLLSHGNRLSVRDTETGGEIWSHQGIDETSGLMTAASPAVFEGIAIVPYNSGEIFALRAENGTFAWTGSLASRGVPNALTGGNAVSTPVVADETVLAASGAGRLTALSMRNGRQIWSQEIASVDPPWVAGDYAFVLTTEGSLLCVKLASGEPLWSVDLPPDEGGRQAAFWNGPLLAGGRIILLSSDGRLVQIDPVAGGEVERNQKIADGFYAPPVVAGKTLYLLSGGMDLIALR